TDGTLTYTTAANANGSATVTVQLHDSGGTANGGQDTSTAQIFTIHVTPVNDPPAMQVPATTLFYAWAAPPTVIAPGSSVTDIDSANFSGGSLTVAITTLGSANDRLVVRNQGTAKGQIGVSGSKITYNPGTGAVSIGTFTGGTGTKPLVITFSANATA